MDAALEKLYRQLPSVSDLLETSEGQSMLTQFSHAAVVDRLREDLQALRAEVHARRVDEADFTRRVQDLPQKSRAALEQGAKPRLQRVINATGVILQTNLGRAPLSETALRRIHEVASGYCNLEMDLSTGDRSRRDALVEDLLVAVGASGGAVGKAATVVNNCAAATLLGLNTLAEGGEVIVSRGELVEIGGGFRIPEILAKSGATLREVGTTNKTRLGDYTQAIGPHTRLILRVHRSNFHMEGFTEQPALADLVELGREAGVPVFDDQGTGCAVDLREIGLQDESSWLRSIASGAALVAASGDKLLGGPQCGLLVGDHAVIEALRANPLFRALRVDKLTFAALEATLQSYLLGRESDLPVVRMLRTPADAVRTRCEQWAASLQLSGAEADVVPCNSVVGGGTTPGATLASFAVALRHTSIGEDALAARLRSLDPPVLARIREGRVLLDLRTVDPQDDEPVLISLRRALELQ